MDHTKNIHDNGHDSKLKALAGKQMPYEVPEGYFEQLPEKVLDRIHEEPERRISLRPRLLRLAAAAAILILIAFSAVQFLFNPETEIANDSYTINDIYYYNLDNMAELEDSYLMSFLEEESIAYSDLVEHEDSEISDEAIMEYLLAENHIEYYLSDEY